MPDDVLRNKVAIVERCLARIEQKYRGREDELTSNQTRQDAIILNLQRACEAAIDLAMHVVRTHTPGLPQHSREAFQLLADAGLLGSEPTRSRQAMVGFRNVAIHNYQDLSLDIVRSILENKLDDFLSFTHAVVHDGDK